MNIIDHISEVSYSREGHFDTEEQYKEFKTLIESNISRDRLIVCNDDEIRINVKDIPGIMVEVIKVFYDYSKGLIEGLII